MLVLTSLSFVVVVVARVACRSETHKRYCTGSFVKRKPKNNDTVVKHCQALRKDTSSPKDPLDLFISQPPKSKSGSERRLSTEWYSLDATETITNKQTHFDFHQFTMFYYYGTIGQHHRRVSLCGRSERLHQPREPSEPSEPRRL